MGREAVSERPRLQTHIVVIVAIGIVVALVVVVYFLRTILAIVEAHHQVYVIAFLALFALWCYWIAVALIRRRLAGDASRPPEH